MNKTPIMILQELGVKECILPSYVIICSQNGTHQNTFTYKVKYNNLSAEGSASNKKEAKQNAAKNMLTLLQKTDNISSKKLKLIESCDNHMTIPKLVPSSPAAAASNFVNFVGILQEYCSQNNVIEPIYQLCQADGPAHNMLFKVSCTLGSLTVEALANTKKQAKQQAAQKMLQNLPNVKNITNSDKCQLPPNSDFQKEKTESIFKDLGIQIANLKIVDSTALNTVKLKYLNVTTGENLQLAQLGEKISIDNYHLYFKSMIYNNICNSEKRELEHLYNIFKMHAENCKTVKNDLLVHKEVLTYIKEKCKLPIQKISVPSKTNMKIIGFKISLVIPFIQLEMSENFVDAEQKALLKTIEAIILYLK